MHVHLEFMYAIGGYISFIHVYMHNKVTHVCWSLHAHAGAIIKNDYSLFTNGVLILKFINNIKTSKLMGCQTKCGISANNSLTSMSNFCSECLTDFKEHVHKQ